MSRLYVHRVQVDRLGSEPDANGRMVKSRIAVSASLPCLIEGLKSKEMENLIGNWSNAKYRITWPTNGQPNIKANDIVTFSGTRYEIENVLDDSLRTPLGSSIEPFKTAILVETKRKV